MAHIIMIVIYNISINYAWAIYPDTHKDPRNEYGLFCCVHTLLYLGFHLVIVFAVNLATESVFYTLFTHTHTLSTHTHTAHAILCPS